MFLNVFGGFIAKVLMTILGSIIGKRKENIKSKENWLQFVEAYQKENSNPVSHFKRTKRLMEIIKLKRKKEDDAQN